MHVLELSPGLGAWGIYPVHDSPDARYSPTLRVCTRGAHSSDRVLCTVCVWVRPDLISGDGVVGPGRTCPGLVRQGVPSSLDF